MKKETITFNYETCAECPYANNGKCTKKKKELTDLWYGSIPDWCPLEDV